MDIVFISMPFSQFDSKLFANVPNRNLGIVKALLGQEGWRVKTYHFHLAFLPYLRQSYGDTVVKSLHKIHKFNTEFMGLDYVFGSILFENSYQNSKENFQERLSVLDLDLDNFELFRDAARSFVTKCFSQIKRHLKTTKLVAFSSSHYQLSASLLICAMIKEANPDILTVMGGKDCAGHFGKQLMKYAEYVDYVGIGECELTLQSILRHIRDCKQPLYNVLFRDKAGAVRKSKSMENLSLGSLPFPRYNFDEIAIPVKEIILPLEMGRGCPWGKCTFCPDKSYNIKSRSRKAEEIYSEIEYYRELSDELRKFILLDPDSLKDPQQVIELSRLLDGKGLQFYFADFRVSPMDRKALESLLRFGKWVKPMQVGIETFSERILRLMKKEISALRNVEVIKMAVEVGIPLQSNLITCYPNMKIDDFLENMRVIDRITHLLVNANIRITPGEFYLPPNCPVFLNIEKYAIERDPASFFSKIFKDFSMPSYSNYTYDYLFDNYEDQYKCAVMLREKIGEINSKDPQENLMTYHLGTDELEILVRRDGQENRHTFTSPEKDVYLIAIEKSQTIRGLSERLGTAPDDLRSILDDFDKKGLILYSFDKKSFLSLALKHSKLTNRR